MCGREICTRTARHPLRWPRLWVSSGIALLAWIGVSGAEPPASPEFTPAQLEEAAQRALDAILALQNPATGLVDSFSADAADEAYSFDQALALIALTHAGQSDPEANCVSDPTAPACAARALAERLIEFQDPAGYWAWAYRSDQPSRSITNGTIATGPNAWVAYALLFYASTLRPPDAAEIWESAAAFADYAIENLRALDRYDYQWGGQYPDIFSTEVNVDMWWVLSALGHGYVHADDGSPRSGKWWATRLYDELTAAYWNDPEDRWNRGRDDDWWSEDAQSWGSITAWFAGDLERQDGPLTFALGRLQQQGLPVETCFHGELALQGMEDNVNPDSPEGCFETIWNEGSGHVVSALSYARRDSEATGMLDSLVASENQISQTGEVCMGSGLRGWTHSLDSVANMLCQSQHYGPELGIHVGASAWVYFSIKSRNGDLLPYRDLGCPILPLGDCRKPTRPRSTRLGLTSQRGGLRWIWKKGEATQKSDLGDPALDTDYRLCLYDWIGGEPMLTTDAYLPAGANWTEGKKGFKYKSQGGVPDGIERASLKASTTGKAKIRVKGSGMSLPPLPLAQEPRVAIQLLNDLGECWEGEFRAPAKKNDASRFKDRAPDATLELTRVPAIGSFDDLEGRARGVKSSRHAVTAYILVDDLWWGPKPSELEPTVLLDKKGRFTIDITTGGIDQFAAEIVVYLVRSGYQLPACLGLATLPTELDQNAVATARVVR